MMTMAVDEAQNDVRKYLSDYLAVRELKRSVEKRLRDLERERSRRPRDKKLRHSISGLRSTLRSLENRKEVILRTLNARLARNIGSVNVRGIELQPQEYIASVDGRDRTATYRIVEEDSNENPLRIQIRIPKLELSRAEELLSIVDDIVDVFRSRAELPIKLCIDKILMNDNELETAIDILERQGFRVYRKGRKLSISTD